MPEAQALSALRRDIDRKPHKVKRVLTDAGIRKAFLGGVSNDERKSIKAFTTQSSNASNALKKHPKVSTIPSPSDHPRLVLPPETQQLNSIPQHSTRC